MVRERKVRQRVAARRLAAVTQDLTSRQHSLSVAVAIGSYPFK